MAPARPALVLLVDDDPASLKLLSEALAGLPLTLAVATAGDMALRQIRRELPDLVLLDAVMPGLDGFEVCRRLKAAPETRDVPVLFMTVLADTASRVRGLELGAVDYVTKPFVREELVARVRTQLSIRAAASELSAAVRALSEKNEELACARASLEIEVARRTEELRAQSRRLERELELNRAAEIKVQTAHDQLAHLNRVSAVSELAASLAHELNQPLAAILSNAQAAERLLAQTPPGIADARAALADIVADDRRAGQVIQRIRAMLRKGELSVAAMDLSELAREVVRLVASAALLAGTTVRLDLASGLPHVRGDGIQVQQVLLNLLVNALDAVSRRPPEARLVVVRTRPADRSHVELSVADSGDGVAPEDLERIFEPFVTSKPHGLGVGLAISRSIVEAHGGRLWAECRPGEGATFRCALPAWDQGARPAG
ncbi:hybrid sensor histidine kinase/response regulator [Sorangium sp. So ce363]|uniref:hybrid sensor histidine kinase/response regulator n=1 Tax=Sorangium sp. So ce363 TaxID=3133304 RepID=UPI003F625221